MTRAEHSDLGSVFAPPPPVSIVLAASWTSIQSGDGRERQGRTGVGSATLRGGSRRDWPRRDRWARSACLCTFQSFVPVASIFKWEDFIGNADFSSQVGGVGQRFSRDNVGWSLVVAVTCSFLGQLAQCHTRETHQGHLLSQVGMRAPEVRDVGGAGSCEGWEGGSAPGPSPNLGARRHLCCDLA